MVVTVHAATVARRRRHRNGGIDHGEEEGRRYFAVDDGAYHCVPRVALVAATSVSVTGDSGDSDSDSRVAQRL
jgi:hypothetical protein